MKDGQNKALSELSPWHLHLQGGMLMLHYHPLLFICPRCFWQVRSVKCHGDTHLWMEGGGAKLSFDRAKVCGGTSLHFHVNTQSKGEG